MHTKQIRTNHKNKHYKNIIAPLESSNTLLNKISSTMSYEQLNEEQMNSYRQLKHEPLDKTLYSIFNIDTADGFDRKQANNNMKQIVRKFHPDKQGPSKQEQASNITKILTGTWRYLNNPRNELCYRVLGRAITSTTIIEWEEIDKVYPIIMKEWEILNPPKQKEKSNIKSEEEIKPDTDNKRKSRSEEKENQEIPRIIRIIDHDYRHKKYFATIEWNDGKRTRMDLEEAAKHKKLFKMYLTDLLKNNSKRYNWLRKNQSQLFE